MILLINLLADDKEMLTHFVSRSEYLRCMCVFYSMVTDSVAEFQTGDLLNIYRPKLCKRTLWKTMYLVTLYDIQQLFIVLSGNFSLFPPPAFCSRLARCPLDSGQVRLNHSLSLINTIGVWNGLQTATVHRSAWQRSGLTRPVMSSWLQLPVSRHKLLFICHRPGSHVQSGAVLFIGVIYVKRQVDAKSCLHLIGVFTCPLCQNDEENRALASQKNRKLRMQQSVVFTG